MGSMKKKMMPAAFLAALLFIFCCLISHAAFAEEVSREEVYGEKVHHNGGGYAATGQCEGYGYISMIYDATNGLPTSDANCVLSTNDGSVWIGAYSGVFRYDGSDFVRIGATSGVTNSRGLFEDSKGRIWVGTNDNGVVVIDGDEFKHYSYKEGLPSSSIRCFAEDDKADVYIGTTSGVCYIDPDMKLNVIEDERIDDELILRLDSDSDGNVYGLTKNGRVFKLRDRELLEVHSSADLGTVNITSILADSKETGKVYFGTEGSAVYHGKFGDKFEKMDRISISPLSCASWLSYGCDRIWLTNSDKVGFFDEENSFHMISDIGLDSGIEMMTYDYQGNMWFASSTRGVMKIVSSRFVDIAKMAGLPEEVYDVTCLYDDMLYLGTDKGLHILGKDGVVLRNQLTDYIGDSRVRCIEKDSSGDLWLGTYKGGPGLIHYTKDGDIIPFSEVSGMPDDNIRSIDITKNGMVLVGTNGGLAVIKDDKVIRTVSSEDGVRNTVFLSVEEGPDGAIYAGTDGDGMYVIKDSELRRVGRDEGLTSDVVMRIKRDEEREILWLVTSNSIEYLKDGVIKAVSSFPYSNNYDLCFDSSGNMWIISSYGIYVVNVEDMVLDRVSDYRLYTVKNGLTGTPTSLSYSALSEEGDLYMPARNGVCRFNIEHFSEEAVPLKLSLRAVFCDDESIVPDSNGTYTIPPSDGRIRIEASVPDYTLFNPVIEMYLEGKEDDGIKVVRSNLDSLEYTGLPYGNYTLHIKAFDSMGKMKLLEESYKLVKKPHLLELPLIRVFIFLMVFIAVGAIVWRVMRNTIIRKQYKEVKKAKEEAERANTARSRFLANMSHEIRTPINSIVGMNEMIMREDSKGVPKHYFMTIMGYSRNIKSAAEQLLTFIDDLFDITKIESDKVKLSEREYYMKDVLRDIISMTRLRSTEKELTFNTNIHEELPAAMFGDIDKIKQIVINLLTNAVKYTEIGGIILSVSVDEINDIECRVRYSVKDTGIGIKASDMDRLFDAYERFDEEKNRAIQGTGLGLNISKRFSDFMGGSLTCESEYGKGSEFVFTITQKIADKTPIGVFKERDEETDMKPYVPKFIAPDADILVVDDMPASLEVVKGLLRPTKVFVSIASSGEECLEKIKDTRFDVVLIDHLMPGMDGVETVERIRKTDTDLPVYALTANTSADEAFYISKGFNGYLKKPIDSELLERTIMKHIPEEKIKRPE